MRARIPAVLLSGTLLVVAVGAFSSTFADDEKPKEKITFADHVAPIFRNHCGSCHNPDKAKGGLNLESYSGAMQGGGSGEVVEPGDPESSMLLGVVTHDDEPKMPPNSAKIPDAEIDLIRLWIEGGALENSGSVAKVKAKPKFEMAIDPSALGKPAGEPAMPENLITEPFVADAHPGAVIALAASPWAPLLAVAGHKQVLLYRTTDNHLMGVLPFPEGTIHVLKFSRNGDLLIAGGGRGGQSGLVVGFDVKNGERVFEVGQEYDSVIGADISPDQTKVALGGPGKVVRVFDTADGELLFELRKHTEWITAAEFSPDGILLATGDRNNGLFIWEADNGREFLELRGHNTAITDLSWRPDSNILATASDDGTIKLWEMENGTAIKNIAAHGPGVSSVLFTKDGRLISSGRDKFVRIWDQAGAKKLELEAFKDIALQGALTFDDAIVAGTDWTGEIRLWDAKDGHRLANLVPNPAPIASRIDQTKQALAAAEAQAEALGKEIAPLEAAVAAAGEAQAKARQALADAEKAVADKTASAAESEKASAAKAAALAEAAGNVKTAEAALAKSNEALAAAQKAITDAEAAEKAAADALAASKPAVEKALADKTAHDPALASAANALKDAEGAEAIAKSVEALTNETKRATELLQALSAAGSQKATALITLTQATAAKAEAPKNVPPAQAQVEASQTALAAAAETTKKLEAEKAAADKALADAKAASQTATAAVADLKAKADQADAGKAAADKALAEKSGPATAAKAKAQALKAELDMLATEKQRADEAKPGLASASQ